MNYVQSARQNISDRHASLVVRLERLTMKTLWEQSPSKELGNNWNISGIWAGSRQGSDHMKVGDPKYQGQKRLPGDLSWKF